MSSGSAPNWGWVLEATHENFLKLHCHISDEQIAEYLADENEGAIKEARRMIEREADWCLDILASLAERLDQQITCTVGEWSEVVSVDIFRYSSNLGDVYDQLEDGKVYFIFGHNDLFVSTPLMGELQRLNLAPEEKGWTNYG